MTYENLLAYLMIAAFVLLAVVDRAFLQRGKASIQSVKNCGIAGGLIRFSIDYTVSASPIWSLVSYRLVDLNNPTTVIHGRAKPLEVLSAKANAEYLFLPTATLSAGRWRLHVKAESVASRFNFLYRLFPCVSDYSEEFDIAAPCVTALVEKEAQPHGTLEPKEMLCADPAGRSASVEVVINRNGAVYGRIQRGERFVIGAWQLAGVDPDDIEFRIDRFFSMTSGLDKKRAAGEAPKGWRGFNDGEQEVFLMSCKTDFVAFGWINGVSMGCLEMRKKGVEGVACSSQLTITCG